MAKRGHDDLNDDHRQQHKRYRDDDSGHIPDLHSIFHGEVASVQNYGVFVKIPGCRKQGLVHKSQMSKARVDDPSEMLSLREKVYCKVINIDEETNKIALSMKFVNQTTGEDLDANNVQGSLEDRNRKQGFRSGRPKIELDAIYNTKCAKCGTHGHLSKDCYMERGGKQYELIPELDEYAPDSPPRDNIKKKKKEKKHKKEKRKKKHKHKHSSSDDTASDTERHRRKRDKSSHRRR